MSATVSISGDNCQLSHEVLGYENPAAKSVSDSNWLRAILAVRAGPFSGTTGFGLMAEELAYLHEQLAEATKSLTGPVQFETMEGNWTINLDFERTGAATISDSVTADLMVTNRLSYEFRTDGITWKRSCGIWARWSRSFQ